MGKLILAQSWISTETSRLIYTANQITSFYVKFYIELKWVNSNGYTCIVIFSPQDFSRNWNLAGRSKIEIQTLTLSFGRNSRQHFAWFLCMKFEITVANDWQKVIYLIHRKNLNIYRYIAISSITIVNKNLHLWLPVWALEIKCPFKICVNILYLKRFYKHQMLEPQNPITNCHVMNRPPMISSNKEDDFLTSSRPLLSRL